MTANNTPNMLIELSTPRGSRGVYVCRSCNERMDRGEIEAIRHDTGEEYCQVYRGLSRVWCECMHPAHAAE